MFNSGHRAKNITNLLFILAAAGCQDRSDAPEVPQFDLKEQNRIGFTNEGPAAFGDVTDVELGTDGVVYILDGVNSVIRAFDSTGSHIRTIGREGAGPGELRSPAALFWGPNGGLWVADPANRRYTVFSPDGPLLATYRRDDPGIVLPWPGGFTSSGLLFDVTYQFGPRGPEAMLLEHRLAGDVLESRLFPLPIAPDPARNFEYSNGDVSLSLPIPFQSEPIFRIGPDGALWYGVTGEPRITRRSLADSSEIVFGRDVDPVAVADGDLERVRDRDDVRELEAIGGEFALAALMDRVPATKPPTVGFFFDDAGRMWVMRPALVQGLELEVFDSTAGLVGTGYFDVEPAPHPRVRGNRLVAMVKDATGVEGVVIYRVE